MRPLDPGDWFLYLAIPLTGARIPSANMSLTETLNPSHFLRLCLPLTLHPDIPAVGPSEKNRRADK